MINSIKDLFDYDLVKKCDRCKTISLKSNFHKDRTKHDGYRPHCKICCKKYYHDNQNRILINQKNYKKQNREKINIYEKNKRKTDLNFKLACNLRSRTSSAFKSQNVRKTNKTFDFLGCAQSFFKRWIIHQLYGDMSLENYGKIGCLDHCYALSNTNLSNKNDMYKSTNWINIRPMYIKDNIFKGDEIDYHLYLLQETKRHYFKRLNGKKGPN